MIQETVVDWLEENKQETLMLGVSGGRDSMCLLDSMRRYSTRNLIVVHINHGLRGGESDADESLVRKYCDTYSIPFFVRCADVVKRMEGSREGLETSARVLRLNAFSEIAEEECCHDVLLAHHSDDQAETVLHNLLRGSAGLRGITKRKSLENYNLVIHRPLLDISRLEINHYVEGFDVPYRDDKSNEEGFTVRNRIRGELLPLMEDIMGRDVSSALCRSEKLDRERLKGIVEYLESLGLYDPQGRLFLPKLTLLPQGFQREAVHQYLLKMNVPNLTGKVVQSCVDLLSCEKVSKVNLSGGLCMRRSHQRLYIEAQKNG